MDKSGDENPRVMMRNVSRVTKSEGENDDIVMFAHSFGNPELEKILELKMMEIFGYRFSSVGTEFNEQATKSSSGKGKRMKVWDGEKCAKRFSWETCVLSKVFLDVLIDPGTGPGRLQGSCAYSRNKASNGTGRK